MNIAAELREISKRESNKRSRAEAERLHLEFIKEARVAAEQGLNSLELPAVSGSVFSMLIERLQDDGFVYKQSEEDTPQGHLIYRHHMRWAKP